MSDDYLWDRSGDPDPEIERLEEVLGTLRHRGLPLDASGAVTRPRTTSRWWRRSAAPLVIAAGIVLLIGVGWMARQERRPAWSVERLAGHPTIEQRPVAERLRVSADQWLETDAGSSARLSASEVGQVDIGPRTRVRLITTGAGGHRLALERGILHAFIWAPPGQFRVETASATAIDLGCAYTLEVDANGAGLLRVTSGWVGFEQHDLESRVPAGAVCATRPGRGPGTPRFEDATPAFAVALATLDAGTPEGRAPALDVLLQEARQRDALTLWHLLTRTDRGAAERVYRRLAELAPPPAGATRELVAAGDHAALDRWWDSLGLGDATLFRHYRAR